MENTRALDRTLPAHSNRVPAPEPTPDPDLLLALSLVDGLGPVGFHRLLSVFGSPEAVFGATPRELVEAHPRLGAGTLIALGRGPDLLAVEQQHEACRRVGARLLLWRSPDYPGPLLDLACPPPVLHMQGQWREEDRRALAVVGTRHPSPYGAAAARKFGDQLAAAGWTVVSGLARGVDTYAHESALRGGGRTVAVLGSALDRLYPKENEALARGIAEAGCVISEFPMGCDPRPEYFPRRNRIIAGLSRGTLVVEAGNDSGSLITADYALDQGREVFAVPGTILSPGTRGTHRLIREGAHLVEEAEDILKIFEGLPQAVPSRRFAVRGAAADPRLEPVQLQVPFDEPLPGTARTAGPAGAEAESRAALAAARAARRPRPAADSLPAGGEAPGRSRAQGAAPADLKESHRVLLEVLGGRAASLDDLAERLRARPRGPALPIHRLLAELLQLELLGRVKRLPGAVFRPA